MVKKTSTVLSHAVVEMHLLDANSKIIEQDEKLALKTSPVFVTLRVKNDDGSVFVLGTSFQNWQLMTLKLFTSVEASLLQQKAT